MCELDNESKVLLQNLNNAANQLMDRLKKLCRDKEIFAKTAYLSFFIREIRIFKAFNLLIQDGLCSEAELLERPFFETFIDWCYIETDPDNLGYRYLMYESAARLQLCRDVGRTEDENNYMCQHGDTVNQFLERYPSKSKKSRNKLPTSWCDLNMKTKSKNAGIANYYPLFCFESNLIHNNPIIICNYLDIEDPDKNVWQINLGPDFSLVKSIVSTMSVVFSYTLQKANEHFELQSEALCEAVEIEVKRYAGIKDIDK